MDHYDVVIVGAGISGLYLSRLLERKGISYVTLEKRTALGTYGNRIISTETFDKLEITDKETIMPIKEMNFYSPNESKLTVKSNYVRGYVTNLSTLEFAVYNSIKNKSNIKLGYNVIDFDLDKKIVKTPKGDFNYKIIIFATGLIGLKFRNKLNTSSPKEIFCFAIELSAEDKITTIIDNDLAKGFYGWIIPLGKGKMEVGIGADDITIRNREEIEKRLFSLAYVSKFKNRRKQRFIAGFIPTSMIDKKCGNDWVIIGDASGGEPMLGGSIHKCIDEARIVADLIEKYRKYELSTFKYYDVLWEEAFGSDLKSQERVRFLLDSSQNSDFNLVFKQLQNIPIEGKGLINDVFRNIIMHLEQNRANGNGNNPAARNNLK